MADMTGTLRREYSGKIYAMRLTPLGIAALQDTYGNDFLAHIEQTKGLPNLRMFVDIVAQALVKGEGLSETDARSVADDLVGADMALPMAVITAAFPESKDAAEGSEAKGNAKARQG